MQYIRRESYNRYRNMWLIVMFDLPVETRSQLRRADHFRKWLLQDGYHRFQYSVYVRHCPTRENARTHMMRLEKNLPPEGKVAVLMVTDKQFGMMRIFIGRRREGPIAPPTQLEMF